MNENKKTKKYIANILIEYNNIRQSNLILSIKNNRLSELYDKLLDYIHNKGFDNNLYETYKGGMIIFRNKVKQFKDDNDKQSELYTYICGCFDTILKQYG